MRFWVMRGGRAHHQAKVANTVPVLEQAISWCLFALRWCLFYRAGYYFTNLVTIYEADSCFLKLVYIYSELVYGWCMFIMHLVESLNPKY